MLFKERGVDKVAKVCSICYILILFKGLYIYSKFY